MSEFARYARKKTMDRIAKLKSSEREELFITTSHDMKLPEAMTEKDFWVCWTLYYLFSKSPWADRMAFKGGTSLSKCYGLIERFSEDIDLILDWRVLGFSDIYPWEERSKTSQDKLNKEMDAKTATFLSEVFLPTLKEDFSHLLSSRMNFILRMTSHKRSALLIHVFSKTLLFFGFRKLIF